MNDPNTSHDHIFQELHRRIADLEASDTELRKIDHDLKKERDFISAVLYTVDALVLVLDKNGSIINFNRACEQATGYALHEVKGKYVWDMFLLPEEIESVKEIFAHPQAGMFPGRVKNYWITKDGRKLLISWSNTALLDCEGNVAYIVPTGIDITERTRTEVALQESEERYRRIVNAVTAYTYSVEIEHGVTVTTHHSDGCIAVTGYHPEDYLNDPFLWYSMIHGDDKRRIEEMLADILAGLDVQPIEHRLIRRDGKEVWVRNTIVPYRDAKGDLFRYDGMIEDITERKLIEREKEKLISELHKAVSTIKTLHGILPICSSCKKIRDDRGYWNQLEAYIHDHTEAEFSHSLCSECAKKLYPEYYKDEG